MPTADQSRAAAKSPANKAENIGKTAKMNPNNIPSLRE
jgi:hypothetical protein